MGDELADAEALLPGVRLELLERLGGSTRSEVSRVAATSSSSPGTSMLIVKRFTDDGPGWARESAALSIMPGPAPAPRLVAAGPTPPIVVMTDVGPGPSLADSLLGNDPDAAAADVLCWARAIAALHRSTVGLEGDFQAQLTARSSAVPLASSDVRTDLDTAADVIADLCIEAGLSVPLAALAGLRTLELLLDDACPAALTPADACPDNNVRVGDGLALIDFEAAQWRQIAWDVAYLSVPWPSCWCSWRIPDDVAERAIEVYRTELSDLWPYLRTPAFSRDVAVATVGWAFLSTSWFLPRALADDPPPPDPAKPTPSRRAMILHRLNQVRQAAEGSGTARSVGPVGPVGSVGAADATGVAGLAELAELAELADGLSVALTRRWGERQLAYAPAFAARAC